ncbi:MAG: hypothetical protein M3R40_11240 [Pseudomonadota bacterium]|nr:hypothetical protein [Pseudomonadota bacterium]
MYQVIFSHCSTVFKVQNQCIGNQFHVMEMFCLISRRFRAATRQDASNTMRADPPTGVLTSIFAGRNSPHSAFAAKQGTDCEKWKRRSKAPRRRSHPLFAGLRRELPRYSCGEP